MPVEVFQRTRHGPTQVTVSKIFFDVEGVVVELDAERPVVPGGSRPFKKLVVRLLHEKSTASSGARTGPCRILACSAYSSTVMEDGGFRYHVLSSINDNPWQA